MRFSAIAAVVSLVAMAGGCGNIISVPDQGVIILGCHEPSFCYKTSCACNRSDTVAGGMCDDGCDNNDKQLCPCRLMSQDGTSAVQCQETSQLCVGRGPLCEGAGAYCAPAVNATTPGTCNGVGDPPQNIPVAVFGPEDDGGSTPVLEQHCQFKDDVCCHGAVIVDAGVSD
jgi:hypothetical protein